jgi:hypothetical protein
MTPFGHSRRSRINADLDDLYSGSPNARVDGPVPERVFTIFVQEEALAQLYQLAEKSE